MKKKSEVPVLYARGVKVENLKYLRIQSIEHGYRTLGAYLDEMFDKMREKDAKRNKARNKVG